MILLKVPQEKDKMWKEIGELEVDCFNHPKQWLLLLKVLNIKRLYSLSWVIVVIYSKRKALNEKVLLRMIFSNKIERYILFAYQNVTN